MLVRSFILFAIITKSLAIVNNCDSQQSNSCCGPGNCSKFYKFIELAVVFKERNVMRFDDVIVKIFFLLY